MRGIEVFADAADYFAINVSSPNTPGLRDLQRADALDDLLARVLAARDEKAERLGHKPVLLKIAPDDARRTRRDRQMREVPENRRFDCLEYHRLAAHDIARPFGERTGRPLGPAALRALDTYARRRLSAGGESVSVDRRRRRGQRGNRFAKIEAGANLVQLYTSFVFKGLVLADEIKRGLVRLLANNPIPGSRTPPASRRRIGPTENSKLTIFDSPTLGLAPREQKKQQGEPQSGIAAFLWSNPGFKVKAGFLAGDELPTGLRVAGSSFLDVLHDVGNGTICIFDIKTGISGFRIAANLPILG